MPYICATEGGALKLSPGPETRYPILGRRDEMPFVTCAPGAAGRCETMMVHRFAVDCGGVRQPWSKVADSAARAANIKLPANLPIGFAPVGALAGRIVLPSLVRGGGEVARVASQDLSPDSVLSVEEVEHAESKAPSWTTTVRADAAAQADSGAFSVAIAVATLAFALLAASLVAAGRWRIPAMEFQGALEALGDARVRAFEWTRNAYCAVAESVRDSSAVWFADDSAPTDHRLLNASLLVHTKLAEAELALAGLPPSLLLRDVLQAEIAHVRQRAADADKRVGSRSADKSAAAFRALHRELERITRIAHGAAQASTVREPAAEFDAPQSPSDAYRILGLNAEAPPAAAKKLIDALRMTWHPDLARGEDDRARREARMKQINAAWDLIRDARRAA